MERIKNGYRFESDGLKDSRHNKEHGEVRRRSWLGVCVCVRVSVHSTGLGNEHKD